MTGFLAERIGLVVFLIGAGPTFAVSARRGRRKSSINNKKSYGLDRREEEEEEKKTDDQERAQHQDGTHSSRSC